MADPGKQVAGMLLYARTDHAVQPDTNWRIHGNRISVQTLDLAQDFQVISDQFDDIAHSNFNLQKTRRAA